MIILGFLYYRGGKKSILVVLAGVTIMILTEEFEIHLLIGLSVYAVVIFLISKILPDRGS